jgi:hypothetical protein
MAKKNKIAPETQTDKQSLESTILNTPGIVAREYRKLLAKYKKGLPPATSSEVLNSACKW